MSGSMAEALAFHVAIETASNQCQNLCYFVERLDPISGSLWWCQLCLLWCNDLCFDYQQPYSYSYPMPDKLVSNGFIMRNPLSRSNKNDDRKPDQLSSRVTGTSIGQDMAPYHSRDH